VYNATPPLPVVYPYNNYTGCDTSNKRQKLCNDLYQIVPPDHEIIQTVWECFNDYENEINKQNGKLAELRRRNHVLMKTVEQVRKQIVTRNRDCDYFSSQLYYLNQYNIDLKDQIETMSLRVVQSESDLEVDTKHYKNVIVGLQAKVDEAERCKDYLSEFKKLILYYENNETVDDANCFSTERVCSVCMTAKANMVCKPCSHLEFCLECAQTLTNTSFSDNGCKNILCGENTECPRCKQPTEKLEFIFI